MSSKQIQWCLHQTKGIKLIAPNDGISENYLKEAVSDFETSENVNQKWKIVTCYYACYNAVYSILMRIGIKCEIHDCTIALMNILGFTAEEIQFLIGLKNERINTQYYLKPSYLNIERKQILTFINKCKTLLKEINDDKINNIRNKIQQK